MTNSTTKSKKLHPAAAKATSNATQLASASAAAEADAATDNATKAAAVNASEHFAKSAHVAANAAQFFSAAAISASPVVNALPAPTESTAIANTVIANSKARHVSKNSECTSSCQSHSFLF